VFIRSVAERSAAEGGEACVEGGGQCPDGGEGFFDPVQNKRRCVGISFAATSAYIKDRVVTKCWGREADAARCYA
jgi:hypothetical protein